MSSALKTARRYKDINSIGLHFEWTHISVVVKAGSNLRTLLPATDRNLSLKIEWQTDAKCFLTISLLTKIFIPRHTIVVGYYGFTLVVRVSVRPSVIRPSVVHPSIRPFLFSG